MSSPVQIIQMCCRWGCRFTPEVLNSSPGQPMPSQLKFSLTSTPLVAHYGHNTQEHSPWSRNDIGENQRTQSKPTWTWGKHGNSIPRLKNCVGQWVLRTDVQNLWLTLMHWNIISALIFSDFVKFLDFHRAMHHFPWTIMEKKKKSVQYNFTIILLTTKLLVKICNKTRSKEYNQKLF